MFTAQFWKGTLERTIGTLAAAAVALLVGSGTGLLDTDWVGIASTAGMAGLLTVLKSLGAFASGSSGPGIGDAEQLTPTMPRAVGKHATDN